MNNVRRHKLGQLTTKSKELEGLMEDDGNLTEIEQVHLIRFKELIEEFAQAHDAVLQLLTEEERCADQEYWYQPKLDVIKAMSTKTEVWIKDAKQRLLVAQTCDEEITHMDSVSVVSALKRRCATSGSRAGSNSRSSYASSSASSSLLKEEAKRATLLAKAAAIQKRQALELEEAQLKAKKEQLDVETAIAESTARIKVYEEYANPCFRERLKDNVTSRVKHEEINAGLSSHTAFQERHEPHPWSAPPICLQSNQTSHEQNNDMRNLCKVMEKQNDITELLVKQQRASHLPHVEIPIFYGDPLEYKSFLRAFTHAIATRTENPADKLYYLEQYTRGEPRDLVKSCQHMQPHRGFTEAMKLLQDQYGNELKIATAYMDKAFQWPQIKPEDGKSLSSFSLFLVACRNAMDDIDYLDEMDNPVNMRIIISKLPYKVREKWRSTAFEIQERSKKRARFSDLVNFLHKQSKVMNDPLFGDIKELISTDKKEKAKNAVKDTKKDGYKRSTFATVTATCVEDSVKQSPASKSESSSNSVALSKPCAFCGKNHTLEMCRVLRDKPHKERIEVLKKAGMCFSCLNKGHLSKDCKKKMSCHICLHKHPTVLHHVKSEDINTEQPSSEPTEHQTLNSALASLQKENTTLSGAGVDNCILAIVPVRIKSKKSPKIIETYAFMDPGSSGTFCTEDLARNLNLTGRKTSIFLTTMNHRGFVDSYMLTDLEVSSLEENSFIDLPKVFTQKNIPVSKANIPLQTDVDKWPYLKDVNLPCIHADVGLLIGYNAHKAMEPWKIIHSQDGGPYAVKTALGWVINGPLREPKEICLSTDAQERVSVNRITLQGIEELTRQHYNHDFPEKSCDEKMEMSQEDLQFMKKVTNSVFNINGHYYINLPVKNDAVALPNNKSLAEQRTLNLRKRFLKNPEFHEEYKAFINDMLKKDYATEVPDHQCDKNDGRVWYIPHHGVYHPVKHKLRVVFDCAAPFQGVSINDILLQGPDLTNTLVGVLTRFRQDQVAVTADVEAMYHQVRVPEEDTDLLRFLWWPEGDITKDLKEYKMVVHPFGATSSPSCATFALRQTAEDNQSKSSPETVNTVLKNFYVDDCLKAVATEREAIALVKDLTALCATGGFHLTKWASNSRMLLASIPETHRAKEYKDLDLDHDALPIERTLGIQWCTNTDSFVFTINVKDKPATRRGILSVVSSLYDPLGFLAPLTLLPKMLLQQMCKCKLGWDEDVPKKFAQRWKKWLDELLLLTGFRVKRCVRPHNFGLIASATLHHFSDASETGYGVVSYLRLVNESGKTHCSFILGKARVAPIKQTTIPRMELTAAVVAVRIDRMLRAELQLNLQESQFWTDSTTVLSYISTETQRFKTFVANRVAVIRENTNQAQWRYVNTTLNPADSASRGLSAENLLKQSNWMNGPSFLQEPENKWPKHPACVAIDNNDVEVKKEITVNVTLAESDSPLNKLIQYYSDWYKLRKAVAWMLLFKRILLQLSKKSQDFKAAESGVAQRERVCKIKQGTRSLTVQDIKMAEAEIIKFCQAQSFQDEISSLQMGNCVRRSSPVYKLDPTLQEGTLRVGGRLCNSAMPEDVIHPAILSKNMHITNLILKDIHEKSGHCGRNYMMSQLRQRYWLPKANSVIRKLLSNCVKCNKTHKKPCEQKMSDLPQDRVLPNQPPFSNVGVDYFGPIEVKRGRSIVKRYGVLFTCLAVRAVHIEVAHSLDTDSCINALRRFMCRRGSVRVMRSDNGTNFIGAERVLRESIEQWNQSKIEDTLRQNGVQWIFNPPSGAHHGGVWERLIRSVKTVLNSVLKQQTLDDEGLQTVLCEVEAIINDRPLTAASDDPNDLEALSPNHLLLLKRQPFLPPGLFQSGDLYARRRWKQVQYMADLFWKRWTREYLPLLQERQKWFTTKENLATGDIVLIVDESAPRNSWVMGKILKTLPDKKGFVRKVMVKTKTNILERPIDKLCLIHKVNT